MSAVRAAFDDLAALHHIGAVGEAAHDAEIVGDEHDRHAEPLLQIREQLQDARLDSHVERGRRLVGDQHVRVVGERHGDHHALALAAGHLVRIGVDAAGRIRDADEFQKLDGALAGGSLAQAAMGGERQRELVSDPVERIERGHRLLEDHGELRAAIVVEPVGREADQLLAAVLHRAFGPAVRGEKAHDRHHGLALARSGFADDGDGLAGIDVEVDALHRMEDAVAGAEADVKIADGKNGFGIVASFMSAILRVESIAQAVADEVQAEQDRDERDGGIDQHPGRALDVLGAL